MSETEIITELKEEIAKLKDSNDMLVKIVAQLQTTLNRIILRYILKEKDKI